VGALRRAAHRLVRKQLDARVRFDSDQVRLDNELLEYVAAHFAATHRHYDRLFAADSVRMDEIDERHLQAQTRVIAHIEDLIKRVELVLEVAERSRLSSESDLRRIAPRLEALERRLEDLEKGEGRG
jgi:EAL domain-containing protein (putative c-di-GMP-specific phosphodiesterase class I)